MNTTPFVASTLDFFGLQIFDIANPQQPQLVGTYEYGETTGSSWTPRVSIINDYAWIADGFDSLRVVDVSDVTAPEEIGRYIFPNGYPVIASDVVHHKNDVFLPAGNDGLYLFPAQPTADLTPHTHFDPGGFSCATLPLSTIILLSHRVKGLCCWLIQMKESLPSAAACKRRVQPMPSKFSETLSTLPIKRAAFFYYSFILNKRYFH